MLSIASNKASQWNTKCFNY